MRNVSRRHAFSVATGLWVGLLSAGAPASAVAPTSAGVPTAGPPSTCQLRAVVAEMFYAYTCLEGDRPGLAPGRTTRALLGESRPEYVLRVIPVLQNPPSTNIFLQLDFDLQVVSLTPETLTAQGQFVWVQFDNNGIYPTQHTLTARFALNRVSGTLITSSIVDVAGIPVVS